jgi:hypothetical protein
MSIHFSMGAMNKSTSEYEYPRMASKINEYMCPECKKNVIFKKGKIKQPHFAHYKSDNCCNYYEKPSETQIHKDAKLLMKKLLNNKQSIIIHKKCSYCKPDVVAIVNNYKKVCIKYTDTSEAVNEHKFKYDNSNKSADVALIDGDKIIYIFEICHTNKTSETARPEPWFEIKADYLINKLNSSEIMDDENNFHLNCIRDYKCNHCKNTELKSIYLIQQEYRKNKHIEDLCDYDMYEDDENDIVANGDEDNNCENEEEQFHNIVYNEKCDCGIDLKNICRCETPAYESCSKNSEHYCKKCKNWKCRCK